MKKRTKYAYAIAEYKKLRTVAYITATMVCLWAFTNILSILL